MTKQQRYLLTRFLIKVFYWKEHNLTKSRNDTPFDWSKGNAEEMQWRWFKRSVKHCNE